jgi:hypothetical protein
MNFKTHNEDESINVYGTSLINCIDVSYTELKKAFGKPSDDFDNYKSDAEWLVKFEDGTVATIYNYKDGKNYMGINGLPKTKIRNWHVGGNSEKSVELIKKRLGLN